MSNLKKCHSITITTIVYCNQKVHYVVKLISKISMWI